MPPRGLQLLAACFALLFALGGPLHEVIGTCTTVAIEKATTEEAPASDSGDHHGGECHCTCHQPGTVGSAAVRLPAISSMVIANIGVGVESPPEAPVRTIEHPPQLG